MRALILQLALAAACGSRTPPPQSSRTDHADHADHADRTDRADLVAARPDVAELMRRADEAFASTLKPDYDRPFVEKPHGLPWVSERYLEACRAGERRACWIADTVHSSEATRKMVSDNCLAGDPMSCRAIRPSGMAESDRRLPGWVGRAFACEDGCAKDVQQRCEAMGCRPLMQQECEAGFPLSCWNREINLKDKQAWERAAALARNGCQEGIYTECSWLDVWAGDPDAGDKICTMAAEGCLVNSFDLFNNTDLTGYRDWLERGCQYGELKEQLATCNTLASGYHGMYREPVPGRSEALTAWVCARDPECYRGPSRKGSADDAP
jgi:hypothetical protein